MRGEAARVTNYNLRTNTITELRPAYGKGISTTTRRRDELRLERATPALSLRTDLFSLFTAGKLPLTEKIGGGGGDTFLGGSSLQNAEEAPSKLLLLPMIRAGPNR